MNLTKFIKDIEINIFDVNFILTFVGFSTFTTFFPNVSSVAYRAIALLFALYCLRKKRYSFPNFSSHLKIFLILIIVLVAKTTYELYLGSESFTPYHDARNTVMMFLYGVMFIPFLVCIKGIPYYNFKTIFIILLLAFILILAMTVFNSAAEAANDGRFELNDRQSTLVFGDNGSYLVVMSAALLSTYKKYKAYGIPKILLLIGLVIGVMAILKSGSRGPVLAALSGCLCIMTNMNVGKSLSLIFIFSIVFVLCGGIEKLENYAPVLFNRMGETIQNGDMNGRDEVFKEAFDKIFFGSVFGDCPVQLWPNGYFIGWHNYYLSFGVGLGIIGFICVICFFVSLFWRSFIVIKKISAPFELFIVSMLWLICARGISGICPVNNCIANSVVAISCYILYSNRRNNVD